MLKTVATLGFILIAIFYFYSSTSIKKQNTTSSTVNNSPTPVLTNRIEISFDDREYILVYEPLRGKTISLIPNFTEKKSASAIAEENSCTVASSGGFYTKEDMPLGLFKTGGKTLAQKVNSSSLLTGFFYVDDSGEAYINSEVDSIHPIILQSGPLFTSSRPYPTRTDEYARRNLVIEDVNGFEYIATIFSTESTYDGPRLTEMPGILFSINSPFKVQRALNLDGGSASFFSASNNFSVSEIVAVGSVLCIK